MKGKHLPNLITGFRLVLVLPIAWLILRDDYPAALALFFLAGASDALDGYLARRHDWGTPLGAFLDPLADKALMMTSYVAIAWQGQLPWWLSALVVLRDVLIMTGSLIYRRLTGELEMAPTSISKLNTALQIALVLLVLIHQGLLPVAGVAISVGVWLVAATTLASGLVYVAVWGARARRIRRDGTI
ncbi:MAG: CDP-alcohol phosphatidyltransferase family protein [Chromatiales bacterium]